MAGGAAKLVFSLLFFLALPQKFKLDGLILASIINCVIVQIPWEYHEAFSAYFTGEQAEGYWKYQLRCVLTALFLAAVTLKVVLMIPLQGCKWLTLQAAVISASVLVLFFFRRDARQLLDTLRRKR